MTSPQPLYPVAVAGVTLYAAARSTTEAESLVAGLITPAAPLPAPQPGESGALHGLGDKVRVAGTRSTRLALADQIDAAAGAARAEHQRLVEDVEQIAGNCAGTAAHDYAGMLLQRLRYGRGRIVNPSR